MPKQFTDIHVQLTEGSIRLQKYINRTYLYAEFYVTFKRALKGYEMEIRADLAFDGEGWIYHENGYAQRKGESGGLHLTAKRLLELIQSESFKAARKQAIKEAKEKYKNERIRLIFLELNE